MRQYGLAFREFLIAADAADSESPHAPGVPQGGSQKPVAFDTIPKFEGRVTFSGSLNGAIQDILLLALFTVVLFALAYLSFLRIDVYSTSVKIALFSAMVPWHALSSHLAKSAVSGHAQYIGSSFTVILSSKTRTKHIRQDISMRFTLNASHFTLYVPRVQQSCFCCSHHSQLAAR